MIMKMSPLIVLFLIFLSAEGAIYDNLVESVDKYSLPSLPYKYDQLQPHIDTGTVALHHQGHFKSYTDKLNTALLDWRAKGPSSPLQSRPIVEILQHLEEVPEKWRTAIKNNGGGYVNHALYFATMCAPTAASTVPTGGVLEMIKSTFRNLDNFKEQFSTAAKSLFGSGYVMLCMTPNGLAIKSVKDQDFPVLNGTNWPILVLDVWEHAYYLKHHYKRADYVQDWWEVVCWPEVEKLRLFWKKRTDSQTHSEL